MSDTVKCLVWDLDNTLWRGTLLEDEEVELTDELRKVVVELDSRGVLQSVASRNDHDQAWGRLVELGLSEYFVFPQIGWGRKSDSIKAIAEALNFATKTIAFIDDQPTERAEVEFHLPEVRCFDAVRALELPDLADFTPAVVTVDARRRREMYQAGFQREAARTGHEGPDEDFLRSLGLELRIHRAGDEEISRVEELTLRTSQMNATGVHYSDADLRALTADPRHEVLVTTLTDRFGPHGAVGVMLIEKKPEVWNLKLLATSCRVVSFGTGAVILGWLTDQAARAGVHLVADFRKTDRNRMMEIAYRFAGFTTAGCGCHAGLPAAPDLEGMQRLHLEPVRQKESTTMSVVAPELGGRTLYEWFTGSVRRFPDEPAIEVRGEAVTYAELHRRVVSLSERILREHGAPPKRLGLLAARSLVAFTGYLAALRLGATVTPLNPGYPAQRNRMVAELAEVDVMLVDESGAAQRIAELDALVPSVIQLTEADVVDTGVDEGVLPPYEVALDEVAYVLFTSGSTGRPKGVPIRHRNLSPYVAHNIERYEVAPGSRVSHTFDLTFDPSVFDLFVTWGGGATLVVPQRNELLTPVDYLVNHGITHWFSVPSVVSVSAELGNLPTGLVTSLRYSVFIGEQLTARQALAWHEVAPDSVLENVYGPTELTVACTEYRLPRDPRDWPGTSNDTVSIGPVYDFLDFVVLDEDGNLAEEGELCVRGSQRFDGYLDPADDAGRFLAFDGGPAV
ncbi:MAG: HAD-IIIC family phosphatase, partial [Umezawaea sp.]